MDNPRPGKVAVVEEVRQRLTDAQAAILTEYRGLTVDEMATLRRSLRAAGGEYKVYKNTLVRLAARDLGLEDLIAMLEGPTAIAFVGGDAVDVAKALSEFSRSHPHLVMKGGLLGQRVISATDTADLAKLDSRDVLLARFAGGLAAPLSRMAGLLAALPTQMAYGLKALIDLRSAAEPTAAEPTAAEPTAAEPTAAEPTAAEPTAGEATATEPEPDGGTET